MSRRRCYATNESHSTTTDYLSKDFRLPVKDDDGWVIVKSSPFELRATRGPSFESLWIWRLFTGSSMWNRFLLDLLYWILGSNVLLLLLLVGVTLGRVILSLTASPRSKERYLGALVSWCPLSRKYHHIMSSLLVLDQRSSIRKMLYRISRRNMVGFPMPSSAVPPSFVLYHRWRGRGLPQSACWLGHICFVDMRPTIFVLNSVRIQLNLDFIFD
jgi:hypothetical protein